MRENFGAESFQQALIPKGLKIICKVSREIYAPCSRGEGVPLFLLLRKAKGALPFLPSTSVRQRTVIFCMDLPFMRTALTHQRDRGFPEVRNPTCRVEAPALRGPRIRAFAPGTLESLD
jgi:hypothetical protein